MTDADPAALALHAVALGELVVTGEADEAEHPALLTGHPTVDLGLCRAALGLRLINCVDQRGRLDAGGDGGQVPTQPLFRVCSPGLRASDVD
jgi:hypothetical protein